MAFVTPVMEHWLERVVIKINTLVTQTVVSCVVAYFTK